MCLIFVSYNCNVHCRYIIAANRDEFRCRATAPLAYLDDAGNILGGQDLQAGGMWLGITRGGKFGAITNYRDGIGGSASLPSRGEIVSRYLLSNESAIQATERLAKKSQRYAGFNVLFGDNRHLVYYSNRENKIHRLTPGFYGLSNHLLDTPWPKVERGKELLRTHMCGNEKIDALVITKLLKDCTVPTDRLLPDTGVNLDLERFLSPVFIDGVEYGTRSTAVIEIGHRGDIFFTETSYLLGAEGNKNVSQKRMSFELDT
ncbi:MAG: hypothetical protein ACI8ZB_001191 [Desulforhopalus sp.]|jgi:uncharacterized protein with NRDE domain